MQLQLFDSDKNLVILQPSSPEEPAQLQAVVVAVAAQYDQLDETILNVPELDVSITQAALADALSARTNPQAPFPCLCAILQYFQDAWFGRAGISDYGFRSRRDGDT